MEREKFKKLKNITSMKINLKQRQEFESSLRRQVYKLEKERNALQNEDKAKARTIVQVRYPGSLSFGFQWCALTIILIITINTFKLPVPGKVKS